MVPNIEDIKFWYRLKEASKELAARRRERDRKTDPATVERFRRALTGEKCNSK